jgi:hypothetical protein
MVDIQKGPMYKRSMSSTICDFLTDRKDDDANKTYLQFKSPFCYNWKAYISTKLTLIYTRSYAILLKLIQRGVPNNLRFIVALHIVIK